MNVAVPGFRPSYVHVHSIMACTLSNSFECESEKERALFFLGRMDYLSHPVRDIRNFDAAARTVLRTPLLLARSESPVLQEPVDEYCFNLACKC